MKRDILVVGLLAAALGSGVSAQMPPGLENARRDFNAAASKADKANYARFLVDNVTWVDRAGRLRDKQAQLDELEPLAGVTLPADVRPYPSGVIAVLTRQEGARILQVWVNRGTQWQIVAFQGTQIGNKPVVPDGRPSAALPASFGAPVELKAIEQAISTLVAANLAGDAKAYAAGITDQFVWISSEGTIQDKPERLQGGQFATWTRRRNDS